MKHQVGVRGKLVPWRDRFWSKVDKGEGCWNWTGAVGTTGYGVIRGDAPRGTPANIRAHVGAWIITTGAIPPRGIDVCHICDNRLCVRPEHLFLGTRLENMQDCARKGRICRGESRPGSKLTEEGVRQIRALAAAGLTLTELGANFGVSASNIGLVVSRRRWAHVA